MQMQKLNTRMLMQMPNFHVIKLYLYTYGVALLLPLLRLPPPSRYGLLAPASPAPSAP